MICAIAVLANQIQSDIDSNIAIGDGQLLQVSNFMAGGAQKKRVGATKARVVK